MTQFSHYPACKERERPKFAPVPRHIHSEPYYRKNINAYLQYELGPDALQDEGCRVIQECGIQDIPQSADSNYGSGTHNSLPRLPGAGEAVPTATDLQNSPGAESPVENMYSKGMEDSTFMMKLNDCIVIRLIPRKARPGSNIVVVVIDRIMRFAIYRGFIDVSTYLIDHEDASLTAKATMNRTAIFYAAGIGDLNMLRYVFEKMELSFSRNY
ncbi:uncharacterized protein Z519_05413 [Cladophialophora bantiana CBS 173.52]|uniref:Uncharacterized protein n=1 Tax=Cladophialophora bantiana (strain ATCC 10958 / CBS 173.52 / CDC B-1940 / NIH 8579) TaxID=1442370 RepID=A0A0D2G685_CLAB1|nr:uncharacterized protein Z519_05413 [Cladophialophora bantiana CBS 173.52]KIW94097.1 hypothetical protein Z519_05413 [Cladophialophora bantiana CBS 173.52]